MTRRSTNQKGFTLAEMLIVVVMLGVVAALGALRLGRRSAGVAVEGLARELYARAAAARFQAVSTGCQAALVLDPGDADSDGSVAAVQLATAPGMAPATLTFSPPSDTVSARRDALLSAVAIGADLGGAPPAGPAAATTVLFYPDGSARLSTAAAGRLGATLYLRDSEGRNPYRITIFGRTGFAKVLAR